MTILVHMIHRWVVVFVFTGLEFENCVAAFASIEGGSNLRDSIRRGNEEDAVILMVLGDSTTATEAMLFKRSCFHMEIWVKFLD